MLKLAVETSVSVVAERYFSCTPFSLDAASSRCLFGSCRVQADAYAGVRRRWPPYKLRFNLRLGLGAAGARREVQGECIVAGQS